jgi:hypothetical protein
MLSELLPRDRLMAVSWRFNAIYLWPKNHESTKISKWHKHCKTNESQSSGQEFGAFPWRIFLERDRRTGCTYPFWNPVAGLGE